MLLSQLGLHRDGNRKSRYLCPATTSHAVSAGEACIVMAPSGPGCTRQWVQCQAPGANPTDKEGIQHSVQGCISGLAAGSHHDILGAFHLSDRTTWMAAPWRRRMPRGRARTRIRSPKITDRRKVSSAKRLRGMLQARDRGPANCTIGRRHHLVHAELRRRCHEPVQPTRRDHQLLPPNSRNHSV